MTQSSIQAEIDAQNARQSRIDILLSTPPPHQLKRVEAEKHQAVLALARVYGHRQCEAVAARIVEGLVLEPETLVAVSGGVRELPHDAKGWDRWARAAAEREPLAKLSLDHSDAELKETIRRNVLAGIRSERRISMARAGMLDAYVEAEVKARIEARSGV